MTFWHGLLIYVVVGVCFAILAELLKWTDRFDRTNPPMAIFGMGWIFVILIAFFFLIFEKIPRWFVSRILKR